MSVLAFWGTAGVVAGILGLVLCVAACVSLFRDAQISGGARVLWLVIVVLLPILGPAIYFGVRSDW